MVPKPYFFVFFIFAWADDSVEVIARTEMKENFFFHILIPISVFKMVCKCVLTYFETFQKLRRRAYAWVINERLWFSAGI